MSISVGDKAPSVELVAMGDDGPKKVNTDDLRGEATVVLFFPLANTGVCEKELCTIRDSIDRYNELSAKVIAISVDSPFAQKAWSEKQGFNFELWSDFNKKAIDAFGCKMDELANLQGVAKRSAFILDKDNVVRFAWVSDNPGLLPDFDEIQAELKKLG